MWLLPSSLSASAAAAVGSTWDSSARSPEDFGSQVTWRGESFREFAPSPTSSEKPTPLPVFSRAWAKTPWLRRLCGLTCSPSTERLFMAWWTSLLAELRVKTSPSPASAPGSTESSRASSGDSSTSPMSSMLPASSGRMLGGQGALFPVSSTLSSRAATGARPSRFALLTWAPRTSASASSSWPTATATDAKSSGAAAYSTASGRHSGVTLTDAARHWPTATASEAKGGVDQRERANGVRLSTAASKWATPSASLFNYAETPESFQRRSAALEAKGWRPLGVNLGQQANAWATPRASDGAKGGPNQSQGGKPALCAQASGHRALTMTPDGEVLSPDGLTSRRLNPAFVEWLMGWPEGWSIPSGLIDSDSSATASSPSKRRKPSNSSQSNLEVGDDAAH